MNRQPAIPDCIARSDTESIAPDKDYLSTICWKRFHPVCLAHRCPNHRFDHGFGHGLDHWYSAERRCANAPSRCAVLQLAARATGSTGPLVGHYWHAAGIERAFVFSRPAFATAATTGSTTGSTTGRRLCADALTRPLHVL